MHADGRYVIEWNNERKEDDASWAECAFLGGQFQLGWRYPFIIMTRKKK
jgi:hypothetical protein